MTGYYVLVLFGLIFTHNLMTFLTAFFAFIYLCVNLFKLKDTDILKKLLINILLIICISACFIFPLLETFNFTDYQVYRKGAMSTKESFIESALDLKSLLYTSDDSTLVFEIAIPILIMLFLSVFAVKKVVKSTYKKEYILFLVLGLLCSWMSTKYFPWKIFGDVFAIVQFPWRFLVFANFFFAIVCALNMGIIIKNFKFIDVLFIFIISVLYSILLMEFIPLSGNTVEIDKWDLGVFTENKTDVLNGMGKSEYLPVKAYENRDYLLNRKDGIEILEGNVIIQKQVKNGQNFECIVENSSEQTILEFPYLYYPGYCIYINGTSVNYFESEHGFVAISLPNADTFEINITYKGSFIAQLSKYISLIGVLLLLIYMFFINCNSRINKFLKFKTNMHK